MASGKPTEITISGGVRTDQYGGWHGNYGYPGYFLASIFDGSDWRKLQINKLVEYEQRSYDFATLRPQVIDNLARIISSWRGVVAIYRQDSRSFTIPGRELE